MISDEKFGIRISNDELPILLHAIVEAKFSSNPGDRAIIASPLLAVIAKRVVSAMLDGSGASAYKEWLNFHGHTDFWRVAILYAKSEYKNKWDSWDDSQRLSYVDNLIAPFFLTEARYKEFVNEFLGED